MQHLILKNPASLDRVNGKQLAFTCSVCCLLLAVCVACVSADPAPAKGEFNYTGDFSKWVSADWSVHSAEGPGSDGGIPVLLLSGQYMSFANLRRSVTKCEFSCTLRIVERKGPDNWIGIEWGVPQRGTNALSSGGYFVTLRPEGDAHLHKGPWTAESKTIQDIQTDIDSTKPVIFRLIFSGGHHQIFLNDVLRFEFDDPDYAVGYCGAISYSQESMKVAFGSAYFKGTEFVAKTVRPAPVAQQVKPAVAVGQKESYTVGGIGFSMAYVPGKVFRTRMDDSGLGDVGTDYLIGDTEVPYELWKAVYDWASDPSRGNLAYSFAGPGWQGAIPGDSIPSKPFGTPRHPVTMLNWRTAIVWCNALTEWYDEMTGASLDCVYYCDADYSRPLRDSRSEFRIDLTPGSDDMPYIKAALPGNLAQEAGTATGFRLPSRAEWELAARYIADHNDDGDLLDSGEGQPGSWAAGAKAGIEDAVATGAVANYEANSNRMTLPVASKDPTALGLYDMSGNVHEWNFEGNPGGERPYRLAAGGAWNAPAQESTVGGYFGPTVYYYNSWWGLRIARNPVPGRPGRNIGQEMLVNGDMSIPDAFWGTWFEPEKSAGYSDIKKGVARVTIEKGGSVQLGYRGRFPVTAGQWYTLAFEVSGTPGHKIRVDIGESGIDYDRDGNIWSGYWGEYVDCAASNRVVTFTFQAQKSNPGLRVNFTLGDASNIEVTVDSVSLKRVAKP